MSASGTSPRSAATLAGCAATFSAVIAATCAGRAATYGGASGASAADLWMARGMHVPRALTVWAMGAMG